MTNTFTVPSRQGLLLGAMLVALHGLEQEHILAARHWGYSDWSQYQPYALVKAAIKALRANERFETDDERILDLMAHTQQVLRVSYEEWEAAQRIFPKAKASQG